MANSSFWQVMLYIIDKAVYHNSLSKEIQIVISLQVALSNVAAKVQAQTLLLFHQLARSVKLVGCTATPSCFFPSQSFMVLSFNGAIAFLVVHPFERTIATMKP